MVNNTQIRYKNAMRHALIVLSVVFSQIATGTIAHSDPGRPTSEEVAQLLAAEKRPPTVEIHVRFAGSVQGEWKLLTPYGGFDWKSMIGQKVRVNFHTPQGHYVADQMVLTRHYLDEASNQLIDRIRRLSMSSGKFRETAQAIAYASGGFEISTTPQGSYDSLEPSFVDKAISEMVQRLRRRVGYGTPIEDVELFHTHLLEAEVMSYYDRDRFETMLYSPWLPQGTRFAFYAIPMSGDIIFRMSR